MTVENIDTSVVLEKVKSLLKEETNLSPALKAAVELLMLVVTLLVNRLGRNSQNSLFLQEQKFLRWNFL